MERKEFLAQLGLGAAFVLTAGCFGSCKKDNASNTTNVDNVDISLDITAAANAALLTNGGYIIKNDVVIAKNTSGAFVAATVVCTHQGNKNIAFVNNEWNCNVHGARFNQAGVSLNGVASTNLKIYNTSLNGNTLRVYS